MCLLLLFTYSHPSWVESKSVSCDCEAHACERSSALTIVCSVHYWNSFIMCVSRGWHHIRDFARVCVWCFFFSFSVIFASHRCLVFLLSFHSLACSIRISFHSIANKIINNRVKIMAFGFFCVPHIECVKFQALFALPSHIVHFIECSNSVSISLQALVWFWARAALFRNQQTIG